MVCRELGESGSNGACQTPSDYGQLKQLEPTRRTRLEQKEVRSIKALAPEPDSNDFENDIEYHPASIDGAAKTGKSTIQLVVKRLRAQSLVVIEGYMTHSLMVERAPEKLVATMEEREIEVVLRYRTLCSTDGSRS